VNIYVGNLSYSITKDDLRQAFEAFGAVETARVLRVKDIYTGRSNGFGCVEMPNEPEARSAIDGLKAKDLKGRKLNVSGSSQELVGSFSEKA
jgi:RNA recognition motif-containing protein